MPLAGWRSQGRPGDPGRPVAFAEPLTDDEIERRLSELDGWTRTGDEISRTFGYT